jgi:hypothetical protein
MTCFDLVVERKQTGGDTEKLPNNNHAENKISPTRHSRSRS